MTTPALSAPRDRGSALPPRPPKVRFRAAAALFEPAILRRAAVAAVSKLDPRVMIHIPVMFVVEIGSVITTVEFIAQPSLFTGLVTLWLWATVLFANFAKAVTEGRGKAQASVAQNNGSAFAGLAANTTWYDVTLGLTMLIGRFAPIVLALAIAGSLAGARVHARTRATLDTAGLTFAGFLAGVIVIVGGLIYFPMLILGPIGERITG
jgi:hypothetical protein